MSGMIRNPSWSVLDARRSLDPRVHAFLAAVEPENHASHHCRPRNIHLSPTGDESSARLTWQTTKSGCSSKVVYKKKGWFADGAILDARRRGNPIRALWKCGIISCKVEGEEKMFNAKAGCYEDDSDWEPKSILYRHSVVLEGLSPGRQEYWYTFESDANKTRHFFHSPQKKSRGSKLDFIVFGDMGSPTARKCPGAEGTISSLKGEIGDTDIIFHNGDISYADGNNRIWDDFQGAIEPVASSIPYAVGVGNHDYDWVPSKSKKSTRSVDASGLSNPFLPEWGNYGEDSSGECGYPLADRFIMPDSQYSQVQSLAPFWYSVKTGPAHFIVLSSEHNISSGSVQRVWMDAELEAVDRDESPWLIILIHRPLYVAYPHKSNRIVGEHLTEILEDTFIKFGVNLVVSGHVHSYYRSCPLVKGACTENPADGITYVTIGSGGKKISDLDERENQPLWMEDAQMVHGYGRFHIKDPSQLTIEFVETESGASRVVDTATVFNNVQ